MENHTIRGTYTALVTPFKEDLSVDFEKLKNLIDFQIENGVEGIVACGSTGESATLSHKERLSIIIQTVEYSAGRLPIIAGTGSNNTADTIDMTLLAKEQGADAVLLVCPYYNKPTQEGLYHHFRSIAEAVDIPQIIYNIPGRSGVNIHPEIQIRLAEDCQNIVATKEASGNLDQIMEIIRNAPDGFSILAGDDNLALPIILMGGSGVIGVIPNYAPKQYGDAIRAALDGNFDEAVDLHYKLFDLMRLNNIETNPIPVKAALALMGKIEEYYRLPLTPITEANKEKLRKALIAAGIMN